MSGADGDKIIPRQPPDPPEPRRKLVQRWATKVREARAELKPVFRRMRNNMDFVQGKQWENAHELPSRVTRDDRYVANVCVRHVQQRTAELYPSNPTMVADRRPKLIAVHWDGHMDSLVAAQQSIQQATQMGQPPDPNAQAILQDFQMVQTYDNMLDRVGRTLEILYDYNIQEQAHPFKAMMKLTVRRAVVCGVGYVKLGFQRAMKLSPEIEQRIADMSEQLANIESLLADMADGEIHAQSADAEALKIAIQTLTQEGQLVVREGLAFDYPDSTAIIPDPACRDLTHFLGANWVAQEFLLTPDEIQEIYQVDVGSRYTTYNLDGSYDYTQAGSNPLTYSAGGLDQDQQRRNRAVVWEIYHRKDGTVYVVCDGYPDFLQEPGPPDTPTTRFWPWFAFTMNQGYHERELFPNSDIDLIRDPQLELNRARQGLREHRRANRPKTVVAAGVLEQADKEKLMTHPANALLELNALAPGQKIEDVLMPMRMPAIDPAVYDTSQVFEDILRVLGADQAEMGTTSDVTATEASMAQASQHTDLSSVTDDIDDMLSELARSGSEILILNVSQQIVQGVVGPGAVWPELDRDTVAKNIFLKVEAGSSGRPNQQQQVQVLTQLVPILQRVPGINPEWLARELLKRINDKLDLTDAFVEGLPSMEAMNQQALSSTGQATAGTPQPPPPGQPPGQPPPRGQGAGRGAPRPPGPNDPNLQGPQGAGNAPAGPPTGGGLGPRVPPPQIFGVNGARPGTGGAMPRFSPSQGPPTP